MWEAKSVAEYGELKVSARPDEVQGNPAVQLRPAHRAGAGVDADCRHLSDPFHGVGHAEKSPQPRLTVEHHDGEVIAADHD